MRRAVWWLTDEPLLQLPAAEPHAYALAFPARDATLESSLGYKLRWRVSHSFRVVEVAGDRGPWKVTTTAYLYELRLADGLTLISYHWHPTGASAIIWPHVHLHTLTAPVNLSGGHFPTGRVALESVVRYAIMDLHVPIKERPRSNRPRESTVLSDLASSIQTFEEWNTWGVSHPPSPPDAPSRA
jgi:hypothetical protein